MTKPGKEESTSLDLDNEAQIGRIVFKAISDIASVELPKVEAELTRQLDTILREIEHKEAEVLSHPRGGEFSTDTAVRVKPVMRQLFLHLQRVLVLNVAQNLSERLTALIRELSEKVMDTEAENEQHNSEVRDLRERLSELSLRIKEYERKLDQIGKREGELENINYEKIGESVGRLISLTRQVTEMLAELSKKYLELKEENDKFKQESTVQH